jgi:hypothetical protein
VRLGHLPTRLGSSYAPVGRRKKHGIVTSPERRKPKNNKRKAVQSII